MTTSAAVYAPDTQLYGVMAEFDTPAAVTAAALEVRKAGYRHVDGYTPYPVEPLMDALEFKGSEVSIIVLFCGMIGTLTGFLLQYWVSAINYPLNIAGRPYNSWPMFIPVMFELTILFGAFSAFIGMFALNKLPQPYHPVFNVPEFVRASNDGFFLCIEASDPKFRNGETQEFLRKFKPVAIHDVPA